MPPSVGISLVLQHLVAILHQEPVLLRLDGHDVESLVEPMRVGRPLRSRHHHRQERVHDDPVLHVGVDDVLGDELLAVERMLQRVDVEAGHAPQSVVVPAAVHVDDLPVRVGFLDDPAELVVGEIVLAVEDLLRHVELPVVEIGAEVGVGVRFDVVDHVVGELVPHPLDRFGRGIAGLHVVVEMRLAREERAAQENPGARGSLRARSRASPAVFASTVRWSASCW